MDHNKDDLLQKSEVDGILTHVPHEECLFGFIISSDANKDHVLDRTEWEEGFAHVGEYNQLEWKQRGWAVRALGPVARSLVSANRWLRGIKMYRFPWYLTLVSTNHASSNPGLAASWTFCPWSRDQILGHACKIASRSASYQLGFLTLLRSILIIGFIIPEKLHTRRG